MRFTRPQKIAIGASLVGLMVLAVGLTLDPVAAWATRRALRGVEGYRARVASVDVRARDLAYVVEDMHFAPENAHTMLADVRVARAEIALDGRALLRGDLVARVTVREPRIELVQRTAVGGKLRRVRAVDLPASIPGAVIERLEVTGGEIVWTNVTRDEPPTLRIHALEATVEHLSTHAAPARGGKTTLELRARLDESGSVRASAEAVPAAARPTFSGSADVEGLKLTDISNLIEARSAYVPEGGSFGATVEVRAEDGEITGAVRPVVEGLDVSSEGDGIAAAVKGLAAEAMIGAHAEDVRAADDPALVAAVPIRGNIDGAAEPIPTFLVTAATALAVGLSAGLSVHHPEDAPPITIVSPHPAARDVDHARGTAR